MATVPLLYSFTALVTADGRCFAAVERQNFGVVMSLMPCCAVY